MAGYKKNELIKSHNDEVGMALVELNEKENLSNVKVSDNQLVTVRLFKTLTEHDEPIEPLPIDINSFLHYEKGYESRCQICTSFYRERAEHVYIEEGRNAHAVVRFFAKYFAARLGWCAVDTHMKFHVNLHKTSVNPDDLYRGMGPQADIWRGQEDELALRVLLEEIQSVKGIDTSRSVDLKLKCAAMLEKLTDRLLKIKKDRASNSISNVDIRTVLKDIHDRMLFEEDRQVIKDKVVEILQKQAQATA